MNARPARSMALALLLAASACRRQESTEAVAARSPDRTRPPRAPASVDAAGYGLRPAEKSAIAAFLRANPDLRPADDDDRRRSETSDDVAGMYGVYHPYFVRGDVNDDGLLDFVLAFVRRDSDRDSPWFSIAVFSGQPGGTFAPGVFLERDISLSDGDLSLDRDAIVVTPDVDDDATRRYRWDPERRLHVFVRDTPDEPSSPPAAQI
jgi:hypothetical protein